jgi:hypothetical protein
LFHDYRDVARTNALESRVANIHQAVPRRNDKNVATVHKRVYAHAALLHCNAGFNNCTTQQQQPKWRLGSVTLRHQSRSRSNKFCCAAEKVSTIDGEFCWRPAVPFEQLVAQVPLHCLDLGADRRLADSQAFGCLAEIAQLRDRDEYFEFPEGESHTSPISPIRRRGLLTASYRIFHDSASQAMHVEVICRITFWLLLSPNGLGHWAILYII